MYGCMSRARARARAHAHLTIYSVIFYASLFFVRSDFLTFRTLPSRSCLPGCASCSSRPSPSPSVFEEPKPAGQWVGWGQCRLLLAARSARSRCTAVVYFVNIRQRVPNRTARNIPVRNPASPSPPFGSARFGSKIHRVCRLYAYHPESNLDGNRDRAGRSGVA